MKGIPTGKLVSGTYKDKQLEEELEASLIDGYLPCTVAFEIATKLRVAYQSVGRATDRLGIRIINCQLGCFTFEKAVHNDLNDKDIDATVARRIRTSLVNGRLPCALALKMVKELEVDSNTVGDTASKLKVKIVNCQLGCFR